MHSAIVAVEMPPRSYDTTVPQAWPNFMGSVETSRGKHQPLDQQKGVSRLGENVWLVNLQDNPLTFARLVHFADQFGLACKILPFDAEPQCVRVDQNPKPS